MRRRFRAAILRYLGALIWLVASVQAFSAETTVPTRSQYLAVAKQGWVFDFRSSLMRRDADLPPVRFDGREPSLGPVCVFGDAAHPASRAVLVQFERLLQQAFARQAPISFVDGGIAECPPQQRVYLHLYDIQAGYGALDFDLRYLDRQFDFDLSKTRRETIRSPAQGLGFFGREGNVAHLMIRQSEHETPSALERDFYRSILVEELFQVFSFGVDILKFDRDTPFLSKLQEHPAHLMRRDWNSADYMRRLLDSNPRGLCAFDVFMLHAIAGMPVDSTNSQAFLAHLNAQFDILVDRTRATLADPELALLFDQTCLATPAHAPPQKTDKP